MKQCSKRKRQNQTSPRATLSASVWTQREAAPCPSIWKDRHYASTKNSNIIPRLWYGSGKTIRVMQKQLRSRRLRRGCVLNTWRRSAGRILQNGFGVKFFTARTRLRRLFKRLTVLLKFVIGFPLCLREGFIRKK